jgi:hypothetical protein
MKTNRRELMIIGLSAFGIGVALAGADIVAIPAATAAEWVSDPAKAAIANDAVAKHTASLAWNSAKWVGALAVLSVFMRTFGQYIPYVGTAWKISQDLMWTFLQHKDARIADKVKERAAAIATTTKDAVTSLRVGQPAIYDAIPANIRAKLDLLETL